MLYLELAVIFFLLFLMFLVNKTVVSSVEKMSNPTGLIKRVTQIDNVAFILKFTAYNDWANQNGFVHECLFLSQVLLDGGSMQCSVWWNEERAIWTLLYHHKQRQVYDLVSGFKDNSVLTTASSRDALTLPHAAQNRVQAFENLTFDALLQNHLIAQDLIKTKTGQDVQSAKDEDIIRVIEIALAKQMAYVKTIPFWQFKGAFWYFISRNFLMNKPIKL